MNGILRRVTRALRVLVTPDDVTPVTPVAQARLTRANGLAPQTFAFGPPPPETVAFSGGTVTIPNVPLMEAGTWTDMYGRTRTITPDDLAAAAAAPNDPAVKLPRTKLGHTDPRFTDPAMGFQHDATPALGKAVNLRVSENGQTLIADLAGLPEWMTPDVMASMFPNRSVEASFGVSTSTGRSHAMVVTATALLGTALPAIETLDDLKALWDGSLMGVDQAEDAIAASAVGMRPSSALTFVRPRNEVALRYDDEQVVRAFYEKLDNEGDYASWVRTVLHDPDELLVQNDANGDLFRIPFTVADEDGEDITFGEPVRVRIEYVDAEDTKPDAGEIAAAALAATAGHSVGLVFATRSDSRPQPTTTTEEDSMDPKALRASLGLDEDATDEQVIAALAKHGLAQPGGTNDNDNDEQEQHEEEEQPKQIAAGRLALPEGTVLVDEQRMADLEAEVALSRTERTQRTASDRDAFIASAVSDGRIPRARAEFWRGKLDENEEIAMAAINEFPKGTAAPVGEVGYAAGEAEQSSSYDPSWLPEVHNPASQQGATITQEG